MKPVSDLADAFDERHGLTELLLGLWAVLRPLVGDHGFAPRRLPRATRPAPELPDDDALALLLGLVSFAWHLEVLFAGAAPAEAQTRSQAQSPERAVERLRILR